MEVAELRRQSATMTKGFKTFGEAALALKREKALQLATSGSLSHMQMNLLIDNWSQYQFTNDDIALLRKLQVDKWCSASLPSSVCPDCHMVGSNCTCGRSWF